MPTLRPTLRPTLLLQLMLITIAFLVQLLGCQRASESPAGSVASDLPDYADFPLVWKTHHPELRKEVARLISERATPALLTRGIPPGDARRAAPDVDPQRDFSAALEQVFPAKLRPSLEKRVAHIYPPGRFEFSRTKLHAAVSLNEEMSGLRERYRRLASTSNDGFRLDHRRGLATDTSFVDAVRLGNRLEALHTAALLDQGQPQKALASLSPKSCCKRGGRQNETSSPPNPPPTTMTRARSVPDLRVTSSRRSNRVNRLCMGLSRTFSGPRQCSPKAGIDPIPTESKSNARGDRLANWISPLDRSSAVIGDRINSAPDAWQSGSSRICISRAEYWPANNPGNIPEYVATGLFDTQKSLAPAGGHRRHILTTWALVWPIPSKTT